MHADDDDDDYVCSSPNSQERECVCQKTHQHEEFNSWKFYALLCSFLVLRTTASDSFLRLFIIFGLLNFKNKTCTESVLKMKEKNIENVHHDAREAHNKRHKKLCVFFFRNVRFFRSKTINNNSTKQARNGRMCLKCWLFPHLWWSWQTRKRVAGRGRKCKCVSQTGSNKLFTHLDASLPWFFTNVHGNRVTQEKILRQISLTAKAF